MCRKALVSCYVLFKLCFLLDAHIATDAFSRIRNERGMGWTVSKRSGVQVQRTATRSRCTVRRKRGGSRVAAASFASSPVKPRSTALLRSTHVLVLPGFGSGSEDYTAPGSLVPSLLRRDVFDPRRVSVLPLRRTDWANVFLRGALDVEFWRANASPTRPAFRWYLDRIADEVSRIVEGEGEDVKVLLIGHSAGGWLARAAVGFGTSADEEEDDGDDATSGGGGADAKDSFNRKIVLDHLLGLVTLGTPHMPAPPGLMDMTRGALRITHERFPGAFHSPSLFYVTVAGRAVWGKEEKRVSPFEGTTVDGFAFRSYEVVCGNGTAVGDGVVPVESAHLDDAIQVDLDGVYHSIDAPEQWYGADGIIDQWLSVVVKEIEATALMLERKEV